VQKHFKVIPLEMMKAIFDAHLIDIRDGRPVMDGLFLKGSLN
jgi:hypothetical protein